MFMPAGIGKRLKLCARARGLSDADVAKQAGIEKRAYNHYANDKREPDFQTLLRICAVLDTTPNFLLLGDRADGDFPDERSRQIYDGVFDILMVLTDHGLARSGGGNPETKRERLKRYARATALAATRAAGSEGKETPVSKHVRAGVADFLGLMADDDEVPVIPET